MLSNQDVRCIILKDTIIHHPLGPSHRRQLFSRLEDKQYCSMYFVNASEEDTCSRNQHRSMGIMPTCMHDTGISELKTSPDISSIGSASISPPNPTVLPGFLPFIIPKIPFSATSSL